MPASPPVMPLPVSSQVDADELAARMAMTKTAIAGHAAAAATVVVLHLGTAPIHRLGGWAAIFALVLASRAALPRRYARVGPRLAREIGRWNAGWNAGALASGAMWGAASLLFYPDGTPLQRISLLLITETIAFGGAALMGRNVRLLLVYAILCMAPLIACVASEGTDYSRKLALLTTGVLMLTLALGARFRRMFDDALGLKIDAERLLSQLGEEKRLSDAARREAEVANRAKTQFFAAASHDLRQPLHALSLFAEALRTRSSHDEPVLHLVNSINASVDALEGLFSQLLDITKIDAGGIEPRPEHFLLAPLFHRLKLQLEPLAFEKGLSLVFRGGERAACADPLLVDRILRNLVSNAIRYTGEGGVLVTARRRAERLLVQVWDSGVGIPASERERVFEEFFQIDADAPALAPHQRKGMGLGLAIVRRLAALMETPITLRSEPGRGSVFTLELPLGRAPRGDVAKTAERVAAAWTLDGRRIVIVENDSAANSALQLLLTSWGAGVDAFDSVAACERWLDEDAAESPAPSLAIVDLRLETGRDGIEAIASLRRRFGAGLPALVVTGSLLSNRDEEAHRHDFHLLMKPVVPHRLRAMIAFKLGLR